MPSAKVENGEIVICVKLSELNGDILKVLKQCNYDEFVKPDKHCGRDWKPISLDNNGNLISCSIVGEHTGAHVHINPKDSNNEYRWFDDVYPQTVRPKRCLSVYGTGLSEEGILCTGKAQHTGSHTGRVPLNGVFINW